MAEDVRRAEPVGERVLHQLLEELVAARALLLGELGRGRLQPQGRTDGDDVVVGERDGAVHSVRLREGAGGLVLRADLLDPLVVDVPGQLVRVLEQPLRVHLALGAQARELGAPGLLLGGAEPARGTDAADRADRDDREDDRGDAAGDDERQVVDAENGNLLQRWWVLRFFG